MFSSYGSTSSTLLSLSLTQTRILAYELGSISMSKIEKEASKTAPRLHKLVGHAAIFDNAARFIMQHIDDSIIEYDQMEPAVIEKELHEEELGYSDLTGLKNCAEIETGTTQVSFEITPHASFNGYSQLKPKGHCSIEVTTTALNAEDVKFWGPEAESSMETYDGYDYLDRQRWSDLSYKGGECKIQPEWEHLDSCSTQFVSSTLIRESHDDDLLLWSQQPRVLSTKQAESLFIEAFG